MGHEEEEHFGISSFHCLLFPFHERKSMFVVLHSDINSLKSGLLHLTSQPHCKKSRSAKVKDGIINLILRKNLIDRYKHYYIHGLTLSATNTGAGNFNWHTNRDGQIWRGKFENNLFQHKINLGLFPSREALIWIVNKFWWGALYSRVDMIQLTPTKV